jgi:acyl-coenzyme A thioesterase PaaI-like protein
MSLDALALYRRLGGSAPGRWLFGRLLARRMPFAGTIAPTMLALEPGRCVARMRDRRAVHNHIGTVHAIACCNLAELVAGVGTEVSVPKGMRWIPKGMTVRYLRKAVGTLTGTATIPPIAVGAAHDIVVAVAVVNESGEAVIEAEITMYVAPRKTA